MTEYERVQKNSNSPTITQAEIYAYHFQHPEPACYTRIPDIIHYLTYSDPSTGEVKKLSPYAKILYMVIKQTAGDRGACWRSRDSLAEICNMSAGMVTSCKKELTMKFHQLDGNSLITMEVKQKSIMENDQCIGKSTYHCCGIVDIWRWNNAFMKSKAYDVEIVHNSEALSPHDGAGGAPSPHDTAPEEALSPHDTNKTTYNKTPMFKEQNPTANADCCFSNKKERLFLCDKQKKIYEWLAFDLPEKHRAEEPLAFAIATKYAVEDIKKAASYIKQIMENHRAKHHCEKSFKNGYVAYLQDVLQNRYWEKK